MDHFSLLPVEIRREISTFLEPFPAARLSLAFVSKSFWTLLKPEHIEIKNTLYDAAPHRTQFDWLEGLLRSVGRLPNSSDDLCPAGAAAVRSGNYASYRRIKDLLSMSSWQFREFWIDLGHFATPEQLTLAWPATDVKAVCSDRCLEDLMRHFIKGTINKANWKLLKWLWESNSEIVTQLKTRELLSKKETQLDLVHGIQHSFGSDQDVLDYLQYLETKLSNAFHNFFTPTFFFRGLFKSVKYVLSKRNPLDDDDKTSCLINALQGGRINCSLLAIDMGATYESVLSLAIQSGSIELVELLRARGETCDPPDALVEAIMSGEISMIEYVQRNLGSKLSNDCFRSAVISRHSKAMWQYLKRRNCPMDLDVLREEFVRTANETGLALMAELEGVELTNEEVRTCLENDSSAEFASFILGLKKDYPLSHGEFRKLLWVEEYNLYLVFDTLAEMNYVLSREDLDYVLKNFSFTSIIDFVSDYPKKAMSAEEFKAARKEVRIRRNLNRGSESINEQSDSDSGS